MARIAKFYERLPKGAAPDRATGGLIGRYQAKYFGKNPSAARKSRPGPQLGTKSKDSHEPYSHSRSNLAFDLQLDGYRLQLRVLLPHEYVMSLWKCMSNTNSWQDTTRTTLIRGEGEHDIVFSTLYIHDHRSMTA